MSNSNNLPQTSESNILIYKQNKQILGAAMALAIERTNTTSLNPEKLINDVLTEFKGKDIELITKAIRNGSMGLYGRTYKLSTQEVCIWIREYLKTNPVSKKNFISNVYHE